ncbi:MAG: DeoR/GlpR family DNA-binding transcription regulator [Alphaproteobacteria bacterium]
MNPPELNNPETRQSILRNRVAAGDTLIASALASEMDVSLDTIRRDILTLEDAGYVQRVRGGAVPLLVRPNPVFSRLETQNQSRDALAERAASLAADGMVLLLDGGSTLVCLAQNLPIMPNSLVVTPSPAVALATLAKSIPTILIGGRLSVAGGLAVGAETVKAVSHISADLCFLGACALDAEFGLGADDFDEASVKKQMCASSAKVCVVTTSEKLGRRARHHVADCQTIDVLVTDASGEAIRGFEADGLELLHV